MQTLPDVDYSSCFSCFLVFFPWSSSWIVLVLVTKSVVGPGVGFVQIDLFDEFLSLRTQLRGRWQLASTSLLQQDGLHVGGIVGLIFIGPSDRCDHFLATVKPNQVQQAAQVDQCLDRLPSQCEMESLCASSPKASKLFSTMVGSVCGYAV